MVHTRHSFELDSPGADYLSLHTRSGNKANNDDREDDISDDSSEIAMSTRRTSHSRGGGNSSKEQRERRPRRTIVDDEISTDEEEIPFRPTRRKISPRAIYEEQTTTRRSSREKKLMYDTYNQHLLDKAILCSVKENQREHDRNKHLTRSKGSAEPARTRASASTKGQDCEEEGAIQKTSDTELAEQNDEDDDEYSDMYSRVKRKRIHLKKDMYGIPIQEEESGSGSENDTDATESSSNEEDEEEEEEQPSRSYYLREHKPLTQRFEVPVIEKKRRSQMFRESPPRTRSSRTEKHVTYRSPAHRTTSFKRRAAFHGSSSTSSSDSSDDEKRFEKRKAKSMVKARNRCLPMNLTPSDVTSGVINDRTKIGSSLADVDPMSIDRSVTFDSVGGLGKHIRALKEMVVFPLLYPEVFERFKISPPRGVLFYGPPGTGKTLVARALANECSTGEKRVAFFMRKGADCLSKWVGESERQLRLLFDQAYQMRPAIIFFDEIDGLAPVRSSRQDQIHSSIVSTLLALMDGLDSRGEIVIIGATNRIDSIDPALRRPGRFDREFLFPLPSLQARQQILKIHTNSWNPKLSSAFVDEVAGKCVGYCGADLKALCTEAALLALRRRYPQIYTSTEKLQLDVTSILMCAKDFHKAMQIIVPSSQRAVASPARALAVSIHPLLRKQFGSILDSLQAIFPSVLAQLSNLDAPATSSQSKNSEGCVELDKLDDDLCSDEDEDAACIFEQGRGRNHRRSKDQPQGPFLNFSSAFSQHPSTHRPRLLLAGEAGQGQSCHLGPAVLHHVEQLPVHVLDLPALFAVGAKTPEESCAQIFREARRTSPSVVYMPHIHQWWDVLSDTLRATFMALVYDLEPSAPILLLATSEETYDQLDSPIQELFDLYSGEVVEIKNPNNEERRAYFEDVLLVQTAKPPSKKRQSAIHALEVLPKAPPPEPRKLTENELKKLRDQEEATLRELRLFLRDLLNKLGKDRKFGIFTKAVDVEDVSDYYEIITKPMDLATMMSKIDLHQYYTVEEFTQDIELIVSNALEYNPDKDPSDRAIRHRACALKDTTQAILQAELDPEFEKLCLEISESRNRRGEGNAKSVPNYYFTRPLPTTSSQALSSPASPDATSRFSRRVRQLSIETRNDLEDIERGWKNDKAIAKRLNSPQKDDVETPSSLDKNSAKRDVGSEIRKNDIKNTTPQIKRQSNSDANTSTKKSSKKRKCIWATTRRRKKKPIISMYSHHKNTFSSAVVNGYLSHSENDDEDFTPRKGESPKQHFANSLHIDVNVRGSVSGHSPRSPIQGSKSPSGRARSPLGGSSTRQANPQGHSPPPSHRTPRLRSPRCVDDITDKLSRVSDIRTAIVGVDSGVGSSIESNGDSLDSVDQAKEQEKERLGLVNENGIPEESDSTKSNQECTPEDKAESPALRMTRSKTHSKQVQRAIDILDDPPQPLILDRTRLSLLLDTVVNATAGYNIEKLEKLHSLLGRAVFSYRYDFDKTCLVKDLEATIDTFTRRHPHKPSHSGDGGASFAPSMASSTVGSNHSTAPSSSWQAGHDMTSRS